MMSKWWCFFAGAGVGFIVLCALACIVQVIENCLEDSDKIGSCEYKETDDE